MSAAKEQILSRIRTALNGNSIPVLDKRAQLKTDYRREGTLSASSRVELFIDRLHDYGAVVYRSSEEAIATVVAEALQLHCKRSLLVPPVIPNNWLPENFSFTRDQNLSYAEIDASEGVLTGCALAIALTGSLVLRHSQEEGRRALTLIPDYHLCVVYEHQIVETVPEAVALTAGFGGMPITTVSGPSATSDIEMTRIKGVHGPRTLEIILLS